MVHINNKKQIESALTNIVGRQTGLFSAYDIAMIYIKEQEAKATNDYHNYSIVHAYTSQLFKVLVAEGKLTFVKSVPSKAGGWKKKLYKFTGGNLNENK